jgi:hypothetical protein
LEDFASRGSYEECCGILDAVYSLWTNFAPIANHPRLYNLSMKMTELRILLKTNCINDIRNFSFHSSDATHSDLVSQNFQPCTFSIVEHSVASHRTPQAHACSILEILGFSSDCMTAWTYDALRSLPTLRPPKSDPASSQW